MNTNNTIRIQKKGPELGGCYLNNKSFQLASDGFKLLLSLVVVNSSLGLKKEKKNGTSCGACIGQY